jgi:hypothetical protein
MLPLLPMPTFIPRMIPPLTLIPSVALPMCIREGRQRPTLMFFCSNLNAKDSYVLMTFQTVTRSQQPRQMKQTVMTFQKATRSQQPSLVVEDVRKERASQPNFPSLTVRMLHSTFPAFLTLTLLLYIVDITVHDGGKVNDQDAAPSANANVDSKDDSSIDSDPIRGPSDVYKRRKAKTNVDVFPFEFEHKGQLGSDDIPDGDKKPAAKTDETDSDDIPDSDKKPAAKPGRRRRSQRKSLPTQLPIPNCENASFTHLLLYIVDITVHENNFILTTFASM